MSDTDLRDLEERWRLSGDLDEGVTWAAELIRQGVTAGYMVRFAEMWAPGSRWRLLRRTVYRQRLVIRFAEGGPTLTEVRAIREIDTSYGELPAKEALARLRGLTEVDLGEHAGMGARELFLRASSLGLDASLEDRGFREILPVPEGSDMAHRFCDPGIEEEVVLRMLASGIAITLEEVVD